MIDDEYYDMTDFADSSVEDTGNQLNRSCAADSMDSDFEDDFEQSKPKTDTSAEEARNGKDIQGIPWERLNFTRDKYRETRLRQYKNYENLLHSRENLEKECKQVDEGHTLYDFQYNTRLVKPTVVHFQLRNLLWATSKHDLYLMQNYSVMHWSSLLRRSKEVVNVAMPVLPTLKYPGSFSRSLSRVQVSTMAVKDGLIVAGGFHGELICKYLNKPGVSFATKIATDENAITNSVDISYSSSGSMRIMTANNDALIRVFDANSFSCIDSFSFPWSVNDTSVSPDGKMLAVLGDSTECMLADAQSGKEITKMTGHLDYSFASAWHPNGQIVATGNQDTTCRLWDIRKVSESLVVLKGRMGAIRGIRFSADGRHMAMAEPADFVHIYDTESDYGSGQEIDVFGEIGGISFSPDAEALFVGISDRTYGSVLEFNRRHCNRYLEALF
ncbi:uncharacterized WD repeat-containing protein C2A9.03-like isoform X2 [Cynara cardunculus var. scolymus]|nr:uncharacterized WD repeat-containing protein C2A9.03-like isoform X2 [Cynara cardunculus var. scolymus]XP_024976625.1 uncharacterized WD repeat-containing protein C2A9.03-like isoform X2 [Cynara cardunculus var. scolymus]